MITLEKTQTKPILHTMSLSYSMICAGESPWYPLGMFSHDFFGNFVRRRKALVKDPVQLPENPTEEQGRWAVFCAASVEYLCQKYLIPCPQWIFDPAYEKLAEPWYVGLGAERPDVQAELREIAPEPFARRNIFCDDRIWANKYEKAEEMRLRARSLRSGERQSA